MQAWASLLLTLALVRSGQAQSLLQMLPPQIQALLPSAALPSLAALTPRDAQVAESMLQQLPQFGSVAQLLQTLQLNSPALAAVVDQMAGALKQMQLQTKALLTPDSLQFLNGAALLQQQTNQNLLKLYGAQSPLTKLNLASVFPNINALMNSPVVQQVTPGLIVPPS